MIKKLELRILVVIILFKVEFGHAQISVPKIVTPISKTACIKPRKQIYVGILVFMPTLAELENQKYYGICCEIQHSL